MDRNTTTNAHISVIIPVYNEVAVINNTIAHVREIAGSEPLEIIVSDGGPGHETLKSITDHSIIKVDAPPGRGRQLNAGAALARGKILLFLHADTRLPHGAFQDIRRTVQATNGAGAFSLSINSPRLSLAVVAWFANMRTRLERIPYGDQAQFIGADHFRTLGGFAEIPLMEDVEFFKRIRHEGLPITILRSRVSTSSRRWDEEGVLRRTLTNWWLRLRYAFGASPTSLVRHYRPPEND
ncbi:TIGR04283 family arsenosugar biosynthesis glycosyltransferase [Pseudodesulfovibrio sp. zrk46]|uniref:TIGR04283 family arsenosugar biosynthesis glycosyltransferase n=1 Tax=Pseudodesulfovibrio sp. zrk46 TaxID=2725288 RepID=UPI001449DDDD|nr:TIGR04283 family arsenosugar biosynthesis glycosyltransferase [Pseudodesulfovibrio sp. zrk46]QJB55132.1 glycosyltransferase family 2 protein [Pseudodesulfovibrio sp. zrk46]